MKTLIIQKNRNLVLAGILAFVFLLFAQITALAYDYGGSWSSIQLVGEAGINSWQLVGDSLVDSDINVGEMPTVVTGTSAVSSGSQITFNGNVSNSGVATSYYRFIEYWGQDGVHYTTPETTGTTTGTFSASVEGVSTIGWVNYRAGVRVGTVYSYGATLTTTSPYNGTSALIYVTPIIIWIALLIAFIVFLMRGYHLMKQGDNSGANIFWALAVIMIGVDAILFTIVWEAIKGVTGG